MLRYLRVSSRGWIRLNKSLICRLTIRSAIRSLKTMRCDSFTQSVGNEQESSQIHLSELLQLCVHVGAIGR
jgi:hypothetical protein